MLALQLTSNTCSSNCVCMTIQAECITVHIKNFARPVIVKNDNLYTHNLYIYSIVLLNISSSNRDPCVAIWYLDISRASHLDGFKWSCQQIAHKRILFKPSCNWTQSLSERTFSYRATSSCSKNIGRLPEYH